MGVRIMVVEMDMGMVGAEGIGLEMEGVLERTCVGEVWEGERGRSLGQLLGMERHVLG